MAQLPIINHLKDKAHTKQGILLQWCPQAQNNASAQLVFKIYPIFKRTIDKLQACSMNKLEYR